VGRGARIAFVEVKTRGTRDEAAEALSLRQQRRIIRAAEYWMARHAPSGDWEISFDVVLVAPWSWPRHLPNAFGI